MAAGVSTQVDELTATTVLKQGSYEPRRVESGPLCLCGTPLCADAHQAVWLCLHCGRAYCRDCGGMVARIGGCDTCTVCGMGMCA